MCCVVAHTNPQMSYEVNDSNWTDLCIEAAIRKHLCALSAWMSRYSKIIFKYFMIAWSDNCSVQNFIVQKSNSSWFSESELVFSRGVTRICVIWCWRPAFDPQDECFPFSGQSNAVGGMTFWVATVMMYHHLAPSGIGVICFDRIEIFKQIFIAFCMNYV